MRFVAAATVSADGYLAGPGGDMSWLTPFVGRDGDEDPILDRLQAETTALLCGARTFFGDDPNRGDPEKEGAFGGQWHGPQVVLTGRRSAGPAAGGVTFVATVDNAVATAEEAADGGTVNVLGASVADQLLMAGRLDEIVVSTVPVLLGGGTRFLDPGGLRPRLGRLDAHVGRSAVTVRYGVERA